MTKRTRILLGVLVVVLVLAGGYFAYAGFVSPMLTGMETVTTAVGAKADTTYVDAGLATKVSKSWFNDEYSPWVTKKLDEKAGKEYVDSELDAVKGELTKKMSADDVDVKIAGKASNDDLTTLRTEMAGSVKALKADLADKADAETVTELEKQLKAAKLEARKAKKLAEALKAESVAAQAAAAQPDPQFEQLPAAVAAQPAEPPMERITVRWEPAPAQ